MFNESGNSTFKSDKKVRGELEGLGARNSDVEKCLFQRGYFDVS